MRFLRLSEIKYEQKEQADARESMYLVSAFAAEYFQDTLFNTEAGKAIGLSYFKERGFTEATIRKFKLGYALDEWDAFTKEALAKGYQLEFLEKTGLTIVKENASTDSVKQFDRFKGRVLFPILSMSGRVLGFGGRILKNDKKAAKYLNSPESDIYHKSKILYGIFQAKQSIAKADNCYLVEGYTDVIQLHQKGIENVVASSGTALTPEQIRLVHRLTKNITVLFDGDAAGLRASLRGIDIILEQGMNVKVCTFPEGEDPDSFARKNDTEDLILYLQEHATDFIRFKASLLVAETGTDPVKKAATIRDIVHSISKIPDSIQREVYTQECARIMDISEEVLFATLAQISRKEWTDASKKLKQQQKELEVVHTRSRIEKVDQLNENEKTIIAILLFFGVKKERFEDIVLKEDEEGDLKNVEEVQEIKVYEKVFLELQQDEIEFSNKDFQAIYNHIIDLLNKEETLDIKKLNQRLTETQRNSVVDILMQEEKYTLAKWEDKNIYVKEKNASVGQWVFQTITMLRMKLITMLVDTIQEEIVKNDKNASQEQKEDIRNYFKLRKVLADKFGIVLHHHLLD
ncbi:MAG: DNA primase [Bacteroidota bacterium]